MSLDLQGHILFEKTTNPITAQSYTAHCIYRQALTFRLLFYSRQLTLETGDPSNKYKSCKCPLTPGCGPLTVALLWLRVAGAVAQA